jgi:hypothetical protein
MLEGYLWVIAIALALFGAALFAAIRKNIRRHDEITLGSESGSGNGDSDTDAGGDGNGGNGGD